MAKDLCNILADLKEEEVLEVVRDRLDAGDDPLGQVVVRGQYLGVVNLPGVVVNEDNVRKRAAYINSDAHFCSSLSVVRCLATGY